MNVLIEDTEYRLLKCHAHDDQRRDLLGAINEVLQLHNFSNLPNHTLVHIISRKVESLQRLQKRAQLIIETARVKDNWSCDWLNVSNLISFDRLVMTYKITNKLSPESL